MKFTTFLIISCLGAFFNDVQSADDCTPGSLNNLKLSELLKKSNEGKKCLGEARAVFAKNYNHTNFVFENRLSNSERPVIDEYYGVAHLRSVNVINKVLNNFGDLMMKLSMPFDSFTPEEGKSILKQIDASCFTSLKTFDLRHCEKNVLDELKNTFDKVESMTFSTYHTNFVGIRSDDEKLSRFFPSLKTLKIDHTKAPNWKCIAGNFPKLTQLTMQLQQEEPDVVDDTHVASLFKENPQIEKLDLWYTNLKLLKEIGEHLPKLKTLELKKLSKNYSNYEGDAISISSVEDLEVVLYTENEILENVVFSGLRELNLHLNTETGNKWDEFISNQVSANLKLFRMTFDHLQKGDLALISEKLPNLERAHIRCKTKFVAGDIMELIGKNSTNIKYIDIESVIEESEQNKLKELLSDKWIVKCTPYFETTKIIIEINRKPAVNTTVTESETGGASPLVMSHSIPMLAVAWMFAFVMLS